VIVFGGGIGRGLQRVSAEGGTAAPVTALDPAREERGHLGPVFLPDGRHFLYLREGTSPESTGVYLGSLDEKPESQASKRLIATEFGAEFVPSLDGGSGEILFLREGTLFAQRFDLRRLDLAGEAVPVAEQVSNYRALGQFSSSQTGALVYRSGGSGGFARITWFDRQGKSVGTPSEAGYGPFTLTLSPDGSRVATERSERMGSNLWLLEFARGGRTRFTYSPSADRSAAWSPDGTKIAFSSGRSGAFDLYQRAANGAGEDELLLKSTDNKYVNDWSRDGRFLLYEEQSAKEGRDLWVLPMDGAGERKPASFLSTPFNETMGRFSPDGRWIAYASDESGRYEIYVRPFPPPAGGGGKWMVSQGGGVEPRWRRDGKELFYIGADGQVMVSGVSASGAAFQRGVPKPLFKVQIISGASWDVSADGTKFLFPIMGSDTTHRRSP